MRLALLISLLFAPMLAHAEPVTTAVAVFAAWVGTTAATVYLVAATIVLTTGIAVYGSAQARRAERAARDAARAAMQDRMVNRIATEAPHRYIYGRCKVGSDIVAMFTSGDRDQYKHLVCVHAAHECDAIEEVYVNNVAVGLRAANGDATEGRYAADPYSDVAEESHVGPTFTLNRYPRAGTVWAFAGDGQDMTEVAVTSVSGRNVTVNYTGSVTVSYVYSVPRRFDGNEDTTAQVVYNPVVRVQVHLGTPDDAADAYLMSAVPDKWKSTAVLRGLCYTIVTLDLNHAEFQSGQVPVHAMIRGRKLYDPRTGNTQWSANPALVIYDYLTSPLCGVPASDLPVAQFITAANVCDETDVPGGRYTINGTVTADQSQATVLEQMAQAMAGGIVSTTWDIYAGKYVAPVAALTQDDIVGAISITPGASDAAIYNGVKGQFISAENNHVLTDFAPYQNATYRAADGRDLYTNIDFPFTASLQRVHNIARIFTEDQRNGFTVKAEFSLKAWPLKIGQRITFTSAFFGQSNKVYRITDRSYSPNSAVELTLKEDDPSIWDFADATVADSTPNTDLPDPWAIAPLAALSCTSGEATLLRQADGSMVPRILASWPAATTQAVFANGEIEVEWRAVTSATWNRVSVAGSETQAYLAPITPGFFYTVRARCVNPYLNTNSDWVTTVYQVAVVTAKPTVYKWAASTPSVPVGSASYDWATDSFGAAPAGWSLTEPAAPAGGGVSLFAAAVSVSDISAAAPTPFDWAKASLSAVRYEAVPRFTWIKYATDAAGAGLSDDPAGKTYIGFAYNKSTATESTVATDYMWSLIQGPKGDQGVQGPTGYTWIKYSDNADGTGLYDTPTSTTQYIGIGTNKATATKSTTKTDYVWSKFKGDQGVQGNTGAAGLNVGTFYAYKRSAAVPTDNPGNVTVDFSTGKITTAPLANGWSATFPTTGTGAMYVEVISGSASGTTASLLAAGWTGASRLVQDGGQGLNVAVVQIFQRSATATAPALPTATTTFEFATGVLTGLNNGWSQTLPAATADRPYVFMSLVSAAAAAATDDIAAAEWAAAQVQAVSGDPNATADVVLVPTGASTIVAGNSLTKANGSAAAWDSGAYSKDSFTGGAFASAVGTTGFTCVFGLTSDPTADSSYVSIDYCIFLRNDGAIYVFENGAQQGTSYGNFTTGDVFAVVNDGSSVKCLWKGDVFFTFTSTASKAPNQKLYFDSALYHAGGKLSNVRFGPLSSNNWSNVGGAGKPEDNANYIPPSKGGAINVDPGIEKPSAWTLESGLVIYTNSTSTTSGLVGRNFICAANFTTCSDRKAYDNNIYAIDPAKTYSLTANLFANTGNDRNMYVFVNFYDQNGAQITGATTGWGGAMSGYVYGAPPPTGHMSRQGGQFGAGTSRTIPATARTCKIGVWFQYSGTGTSNVEQDFQDLRLEQVVGAALLDPATNAALANFNASNDRNGAAVTAPTVVVDGSAVDHTLRTDGAADVSFEWVWGGNEGDIDGFIIYVYQSASSAAYSFGTTPIQETAYVVPASKRAFILQGAAANNYVTFGVQAYRAVDKDIAPSGVIKSLLVKPSLAAENPYRPSSSVAYNGDVTGTVAGTAASTVVANAAAGAAANSAMTSKPTVSVTAPSGSNYPNGSTSFGAFAANITGNGPFKCAWVMNQKDSTPSPMVLESTTTASAGLSGPGLTNASCLVSVTVTVTDTNGLTATAGASKNVIWGVAP